MVQARELGIVDRLVASGRTLAGVVHGASPERLAAIAANAEVMPEVLRSNDPAAAVAGIHEQVFDALAVSAARGIMSGMQANARCRVCDEAHLLTRDGVMSIHNDATGARCPGSVGTAPRKRTRPEHPREPRDDKPKLRLERNHPPYSDQWLACDECGMRVPVTIYGTLAAHKVAKPGKPQSKKASKAARRLCPGSDFVLPEYDLQFKVAPPPVMQARADEPPKEPRRRVECPRCGVVVTVRGDGPLPAHQRPSFRWCAEGLAPTEAERAKAKGRRRKGSVWSVGGGLPTLGKGN